MDWLPEHERRIEQTTAVRDTDALPKVVDAGKLSIVGGVPVQVMHNGVLVERDCYGGPWMTEIIRRLGGHHEPQEEFVLDAIVRRLQASEDPVRVIELGSFWSYYSLWLKTSIPAAQCLMVEPDPRNLAVGQRNFALNDVDGEFMQAAVGDHGTRIEMVTESESISRTVDVVSVDGLLEAHGGAERLSLLLCDVQGAELAALAGSASAVAAGRIRFVLVSTHHHSVSDDPLTHQKCLTYLRGQGAHIIAEHSVYESCSGDGLIAASFDSRDRELVVDVSRVRARDCIYGEPEVEIAELRERLMRYERLPGMRFARWLLRQVSPWLR